MLHQAVKRMEVDGRRLAPLFVALAAFALALVTPPGDPDTYWHLASGKWMLEHGERPALQRR